MDNLTKAGRSALMSRITGDNLKPERLLDAALAALNVPGGYIRNPKTLPGKPDFVFGSTPFQPAKLAVFVHGCFWHGCPEHYRTPKTRSEHWDAHVAKNRRRDQRVRRALRKLGYRTAVVWEHDLKKPEQAGRAAEKISRKLLTIASRLA